MQNVNKYAYISSAETYNLCTGGAVLESITVGETAAGTITVQDVLPSGAVTVAVLKASIAEGTYKFKVAITGTLRVVTAAGSKLTVAYRPSGQ